MPHFCQGVYRFQYNVLVLVPQHVLRRHSYGHDGRDSVEALGVGKIPTAGRRQMQQQVRSAVSSAGRAAKANGALSVIHPQRFTVDVIGLHIYLYKLKRISVRGRSKQLSTIEIPERTCIVVLGLTCP